MEINKAVDLLDNLIGMVDDNQGNDYDTAFHMAIDALKAQEVSNDSPKVDSDSGDTISRQAACDAVCKAGCDSGFCGVECPEVMALRNLQPVHSEVLACGEGELIAQPEKHTEERTETHACDLISRQDAIKAVEILLEQTEEDADVKTWNNAIRGAINSIKHHVPPALSEPAIPLQWIEAQIEWLKSLDNAFATLTARQISAMVNNWKDEQDGVKYESD